MSQDSSTQGTSFISGGSQGAYLRILHRSHTTRHMEYKCQKVICFLLETSFELLRVPWTARRSSHSILMEISPEYSLEGLMLKLKLQYFGHLMWRTDSLEKTLMLGKTESRRRRDNRGGDCWMASPTQRTWVWANSGSWWWTRRPGVLQSMRLQRVGHDWETKLHWTELMERQRE